MHLIFWNKLETKSRCNQQRLQRGLIIKKMMTQAVMEATINAIQRHPDVDKKVLQHGSKHQIHDETRLVKRGSNH
ncbi:hypothetical protein Goshw_018974, partial [Gossypium schwendimanii]|nr:hypothetical protein [Gossypium schwendimanii]